MSHITFHLCVVKRQENSHKHTKRDGSECQELVTGVTNDYYPVHYCRFSFQSFTNPQSCKFAVCHNCYNKVNNTKTNERSSRTRQTHADEDKMKEKIISKRRRSFDISQVRTSMQSGIILMHCIFQLILLISERVYMQHRSQ